MNLKNIIRSFPDFPKKGILFRDITPILKNPDAMDFIATEIYEYYKDKKIDLVAGIESRGLVFASVIAKKFNCGLVMVRKIGKLPGKTETIDYDIEYGSGTMEMQVDAISPGQNILIIDDLLATGGTAKAAADLIEKLQGNIIGFAFVIELKFLEGKKLIGNYDCKIITEYSD